MVPAFSGKVLAHILMTIATQSGLRLFIKLHMAFFACRFILGMFEDEIARHDRRGQDIRIRLQGIDKKQAR
jgi:hypothetical protein